MSNLEKAKELLKEGHTCVLVKDDEVLISDKNGIRPMVEFIENGTNLTDFCVADKIVGKAVALLFALCKIKEVFAEVISKSAILILEKYKIAYSYDVLTEKIINRQGTGICPMEECVANIDDPKEAFLKIKEKLLSLKSHGQATQQAFENVTTNFGFGLMRLPMKNNSVDFDETNKMVDRFMQDGFTYFDTAHGYLGGQSEIAFRECVAKRYSREQYTITNKLTAPYFNSEQDIYPFFERQLEACGVDYFDFYFMHAQGRNNYDKFQRCHAYEAAQNLKAQGKIRHVGISFHDTAEFLEKILTDHPEIELVQIQLNYVDYLDSSIQSKKCLEVCNKYNKPVVVMEPVKGGSLVNLPAMADKILRELGPYSNAGYAIRFAASQNGVFMVLSGMSNIEQMEDNLSTMKNFIKFSDKEYSMIDSVCKIFKGQDIIPCTNCRYCVDGCPMKILIPDLFADMNAKYTYNDWNADYYYKNVHTTANGKASACIKCGKCEKTCPQHLNIRELLQKIANEFEN